MEDIHSSAVETDAKRVLSDWLDAGLVRNVYRPGIIARILES